MALYHIIPAFTDIALNISGRRPFDDGMHIVPGMWAGILTRAAQRRGKRMYGHIPAVVISIQLDQWINAAYECNVAIYNCDLLVQRLDRMMQQAARTVIEDAGHTNLRKLLMSAFWIVVRGNDRKFDTIPQQHPHIDTLTDRIAKRCLYRKIMGLPERDIGLL